MYSGEKSLRMLLEKWLKLGAATTVHLSEFNRLPSDRTRYVRAVALRPEGLLTIVFFRQVGGSWNVYPPKPAAPTMRAPPIAA